jgi:hypothetical protein
MSYILHDPDEWETVSEYRPCTACRGDLGKCNGCCNGMAGYSQRRRAAAEIAAIKAKRQREHEDKILAEAELIKLRRNTPVSRPQRGEDQ